jgi:hypothetical protein
VGDGVRCPHKPTTGSYGAPSTFSSDIGLVNVAQWLKPEVFSIVYVRAVPFKEQGLPQSRYGSPSTLSSGIGLVKVPCRNDWRDVVPSLS